MSIRWLFKRHCIRGFRPLLATRAYRSFLALLTAVLLLDMGLMNGYRI